jgi:DNA modification methylase
MKNRETDLPTLPDRFEYKLDLGPAATTRELKKAPRHRWFYFPHSFSPRLVFQLLDYWNIPEGSQIVDNFVGSGTTLLACREHGMACLGFDLSPLAVMVTNTKLAFYDPEGLRKKLNRILATGAVANGANLDFSPRLSKAFTTEELGVLSVLLSNIRKLREPMRSFFRLAFLWTARSFSRAVPDGGWFRWQEWPDRSKELLDVFQATSISMIGDVEALNWDDVDMIGQARLADARKLPVRTSSVDVVITSPPYANRHDYSRIFHIELLLLGLSEKGITKLRHKSFRSHVEARDPSGFKRKLAYYHAPDSLNTLLDQVPTDADERIVPLLMGYFQDMYLSLLEVARMLRKGGHGAYVVGNVRHAGVMIPVDAILGELAPQVGLEFEKAWVLRRRGNSAQQMGQYGREPSRESIVLLKKTG